MWFEQQFQVFSVTFLSCSNVFFHSIIHHWWDINWGRTMCEIFNCQAARLHHHGHGDSQKGRLTEVNQLCWVSIGVSLPRERFTSNHFSCVFSIQLQIRVVNAFRQGLDTRYGERSNPSIAAVLQKQASLSKRLSQASSIEYADNYPYEVSAPEFERLSSRSHTETAV